MKFSINKQDRYAILKLEEEKLNSLIAPDLKAEAVLLNNEGIRNVIFDLSDVKYADSSGLSAILVAHRLCKNLNGTFVASTLQDGVSKLIKISQLDTILNVVPTLQEAIDMVLLDEVERDVRGPQ